MEIFTFIVGALFGFIIALVIEGIGIIQLKKKIKEWKGERDDIKSV